MWMTYLIPVITVLCGFFQKPDLPLITSATPELPQIILKAMPKLNLFSLALLTGLE